MTVRHSRARSSIDWGKWWTISSSVVDFGTVPAEAVGFLGSLSHPIRVNTGRGTSVTTVVENNSWIEYPSPRIALGTVN